MRRRKVRVEARWERGRRWKMGGGREGERERRERREDMGEKGEEGGGVERLRRPGGRGATEDASKMLVR